MVRIKLITKKYQTMNALKYLGILVLLIGVGVLAIPAFSGTMSNGMLIAGLVLVLLGYVGHIILNKNSKRME